MRGTVQLKLDTKFIPLGDTDIAHQQYKGTKNKYIVFTVESPQGVEFGDNTKIVGRTYINIKCFSTSRAELETMANKVIEAMDDYECIDEGSDIPAEPDADIWGIELEFAHYGY